MALKELFTIVLLILLLPFSFIVIVFIPLISIYKYGKHLGNKKFKKHFLEEINKITLSNLYLYFRDIPNKYGIGVAGYILGYDLSYSDAFAGIIDLSAKGYIKIIQKNNYYEVIDNKKDRSTLLKNERFLLEWLLDNNKKISLNDWKQTIKEDVQDLNLVSNKQDNDLENMDKQYNHAVSYFGTISNFKEFMNMKISKISIVLVIIFGIITMIIEQSIDSLIIYIICSPLIFGLSFLVLFFTLLPISLLFEGRLSKYREKSEYYLPLNNTGIEEYHELYSLGKFLNDFGDIASKHIEEVVIWEQYLSYSILFKINKDIIKTGCDKLINNECFNLNNIEKLKINKRFISNDKSNIF